MTKKLPYGCIKKSKKFSSLREFNVVLRNLSHEDKSEHLFIVDFKFHDKNPKTRLFNEIYTPIFGKQNAVKAHERSVLQLMSFLRRNRDKDFINNFKYNAKKNSTMDEKKFIPLYAERIHFVVTKAGWLVTKIYQHYTFGKINSNSKKILLL